MTDENPKIWKDGVEHPSEDLMLCFIDGELSTRDADEVKGHLDQCWHCRADAEKLQAAISLFVDFDKQLLQPNLERADRWNDRPFRFHGGPAETVRPGIVDRIKQGLDRLSLVISHPARVRALVSGVTLTIIGALFYNFILIGPVSAAEVINRAIAEQAAEMSGVDQPVVRQSIQVRRGSDSQPVSWEIWNDTVNSRVKTAAFSENSKPLDQPAVITELRTLLRINHMNEQRPLTAASYKSWSDTLSAKNEQVITDETDLTVVTERVSDAQNGQISEARLGIRKSDYHPTSLYIKVRNSVGSDAEFNLVEENYAVLALKDVDPSVFSDPARLEIATNVGAAPSAVAGGEAPQNGSSGANSNANAKTNVPATLETEVEVVKLLDSINALSGDRIGLTRENGQLKVAGIVYTEQRKNEIIAALEPVRVGRGVVIDIETADEAASRRKQAQIPQGTISSESVTVAGDQSYPVETEIRAALARRGVGADKMDGEIRAVVNTVTATSRVLRRNALALKQITERFTPAEVERLEPVKKQEYKALVRSRARAVEGDIQALQSQLTALFPGSQSSAGDGADVKDAFDIAAAAGRLFGLASATDAQVSQSFSISSGGKGAAPVRSAQFWRNLAQMSAIAAELQTF